MSGVAPFLPPCNSFTTCPLKLPLFSSPHKYNASPTRPRLLLLQGRCSGLSICASSKRRSRSNRNSSSSVAEGQGEEKMMLMMPFHEMQRWFRNKPQGFGEGKVYDTSVEDQLIQEMEQSRKAQLANLTKLRITSPQHTTHQEPQAVRRGIQVRLTNLPKKKNIHRDLHLAFSGFPGIIHISPVVSGNKKTRDPVCKGFAYLYLESEQAAQRFVQMYSKLSIQFGKIQKQIGYEITSSSQLSESDTEHSTVASVTALEQRIPDFREMIGDIGEKIVANYDVSLQWDSHEELLLVEHVSASHGDTEMMEIICSSDEEDMFPHAEVIDVDCKEISISDSDLDEDEKVRETKENRETITGPVSLKKQRKKQVVRKGKRVEEKSEKDKSLNIPGSANRLKIKERAVLTGVLSKYTGKPIQ